MPDDKERDAAYDKIDRFLRNNLDDTDYAEYSEALELVYAAEIGKSMNDDTALRTLSRLNDEMGEDNK